MNICLKRGDDCVKIVLFGLKQATELTTAAAFVTGVFAEHGWDKRYPTAVAAMAIGSLIILAAGCAWFAILTNTPAVAALKIAWLPFLPGDLIKILLGAAVLPTGWALLKRKASGER